MLDTALALQTFFSSFGIPAFVQGKVPEFLYNAETQKEEAVNLPYITYELREPAPGQNCHLMAHVWYRGNSVEAISRKVDDIKNGIGGGVSIPVPGGAVYLWPEDIFCQFRDSGEPEIQCAYLQFVMGGYKP